MNELRELIYRERNSLDTLLQENDLWEDLYENLYLDLVDKLREDYGGYPAIERFNDVYFLCLRVLIDRHPEDCFKQKYLQTGFSTYNEFTEDSEFELALAYAVLYLSNHARQKNVKRFLERVEKYFGNGHYIFSHVSKFLESADIYAFYIDITPKNPDELELNHLFNTNSFWRGLFTNSVFWEVDGYSEKNIRWVLSLYDKQEDKCKIFKQICETIESYLSLREELPCYKAICMELYEQVADEEKIDASFSNEEETPESYESLQRDNTFLTKENAELRQQLDDLNKLKDTLQKQFDAVQRAHSTMQTIKELSEQEIEEIRITAKREAFKQFVEAIVEVGEEYPSSSNDKAEVIRSLLLEKAVYGHIPAEALTDGIRNRINALGRKESLLQIGTMKVENLNDIHDNKTVNYGSKG